MLGPAITPEQKRTGEAGTAYLLALREKDCPELALSHGWVPVTPADDRLVAISHPDPDVVRYVRGLVAQQGGEQPPSAHDDTVYAFKA